MQLLERLVDWTLVEFRQIDAQALGHAGASGFVLEPEQ
jgi:hypothetical protein